MLLILPNVSMYRVFSLTAPPQICLDWPPPKFFKCWNHIHFARHLDVFRSKGGPVWDSDGFFKSVTYRPTLSEYRGGPVKKNTLYHFVFFFKFKVREHTRRQGRLLLQLQPLYLLEELMGGWSFLVVQHSSLSLKDFACPHIRSLPRSY